MTRKEAERLQDAWKRDGDKPCRHEHLKLEHTIQRDHAEARNYFCLLCGAEMGNPPGPQASPFRATR